MSLISRKIQKKKNERIKAREEELASLTGLYFRDSVSSENEGFPFLKYIINALILFGTTYGSIACMISAFSLNMSVRPLVLTCIAASLIFSFMYISFKTKVLTYLFILFSVIFAGLRYFAIVNSGFNAIMNNVLKEIDRVSELPFLREFTIFYEDEYTAMSVAICVIAVALMMFLNIFVSEKMSPVMVFLLSFPIAQTGMYFGLTPSKIAMVCLVSGWVMVAAVRFTNAYNGLTDKLVGTSSVKKHRHTYGFVTDPKNVSAIAMIWLAFIFVISGLTFYAVPAENFKVPFLTPIVKQSTERGVKNFLSYGVSSLFSAERFSDEPGRLSNTKSVSFDGKTDLKVTLVDYREDRIYLRSFAGYDYDPEKLEWKQPKKENDRDLFGYTASLLEKDFESGKEVSRMKHRMSVRLVDPELKDSPLNVPYFGIPGDECEYESSAEIKLKADSRLSADDEFYYTFYTLDEKKKEYSAFACDRLDESGMKIFDEIAQDAYENALTVPERNLEAISAFCNKYGISADDKNPADAVVQAFEDNFEYTLRPGKIPLNEDYINYFLTGSMKGYCQHFASAAVMVFRYLGVPARYAEGYLINRMQIIAAEETKGEKSEEWLEGADFPNMTVKTVSVPDSNRHAWVEIYEDGIGWVPVEVTTAMPADDEPSRRGGFLSMLFGGISAVQSSSSGNSLPSISRTDTEKAESRLLNLLIILLCAAFLTYILRMVFLTVKRHRGFSVPDGKTRVYNRYAQLCETAVYIFGNDAVNLSYRDFSAFLKEKSVLTEEESETLCEETERVLFGGKAEDEVYEKAVKNIIDCRKKLVASMPFIKKAGYYLIKILW